MPSPPPRKFAAEPVETSSKSTRQSPPKSSRFAVEPVETSSRSSKDSRPNTPETGELKRPARRFAPQPIETKTTSSKDKKDEAPKPARKFAPEPVETSHTSSKDKSTTEAAPKPRKFDPQPIGTWSKSSKDSKDMRKPQIRFAPVPVETTHTSNRKRPTEDGVASPAPPRKFAPILLDTAQRSRRNNKAAPRQADYKTEAGHSLHAQEHRRHITGTKTPAAKADEDAMEIDEDSVDPKDLSSELNRQISPLSGARPSRSSMSSQRSPSFRCPELDTIESSESERNSNTSPSSSPGQGSPITGSDSSFTDMYKQHATRIRESIDEGFAHYLLELEAKKHRERMQEAALAAFANSDFHEPVEHYVDEEEEFEVEDRPVTWEGHDADVVMDYETFNTARRESTAKITWEQMEMQRHAEKLEQERNAAKTTAAKEQAPSPWWNPAAALGHPPPTEEMRSMQERARPPMLGDELVFPRCPSPEPARFDVTQGSAALRNQMSYLSEQSKHDDEEDKDPGLWTGPDAKEKPIMSMKSPAGSKSSVKGLWGGFCIEEENNNLNAALAPPPGPTGLMTPAVQTPAMEQVNPFEMSFAVPSPRKPNGVPAAQPENPHVTTPPTPPVSSKKEAVSIDGVLGKEKKLEKKMADEFPDSFITQVYNYLSLGYPSLARPFDEELSKISRFTMAELRQDDKTARELPRGYIRLGPDFEGHVHDEAAAGVTEQTCMRWQALRRYVHEWARQEHGMVQIEGPQGGNWGTGARRGSWAI